MKLRQLVSPVFMVGAVALAFGCAVGTDAQDSEEGTVASVQLAADNGDDTNDGPNDFNQCVISCNISYSYCQEHQSHEADCDAKLEDCYNYCTDVFPARRLPPIQVRPPRERLIRSNG